MNGRAAPSAPAGRSDLNGNQMPKHNKVTIRDIAEAVGMSASTVSRVLNRSPLVDPKRAEAVRRVAEELGYQPGSKRRQAARTILNIALVLPAGQAGYLHLFYDPAELIRTIQGEFGGTKVNIVTVTDTGWDDLFTHKKMGTLDACILAFLDPPQELLERLAEWRIPGVLLNRIHEHVNYVISDNRGGMQELVGRVLARRGPSATLCYVDFPQIPQVSKERRAGFRAGCREHALSGEQCTEISVSTLGEIDDSFFRRIHEKRIDALLCFNDVIAVYVYQAALHRRIYIPDDMGLTGFDNSPVRSLVDRSIDTMDFRAPELGAVASHWLQRRIIDRVNTPLRRSITPTYVPGDTL